MLQYKLDTFIKMKLLWPLLLLCGLECKVVFRTRWPTYHVTREYGRPIKPNDYCNADLCPANTSHITCGTQFWSPKCGKYHEGARLTNCRNMIITALNDIRTKVILGKTNLPKGTEIVKVMWDRDLAKIAMRITNQCIEHPVGICANTPRYRDVGEASDFVVLRPKSNPNIVGFFNIWFKQSFQLNSSDVTSFRNTSGMRPQLLAFANMIYSKNKKFGCGLLNTSKKRFITCLFNQKVKQGVALYAIKKQTIYAPVPIMDSY